MAIEVKNSFFAEHWDTVFEQTNETRLGWYESEQKLMLKLVAKAKMAKSARILVVGAGKTRLIDDLLNLGYKNIIKPYYRILSLK